MNKRLTEFGFASLVIVFWVGLVPRTTTFANGAGDIPTGDLAGEWKITYDNGAIRNYTMAC